MRLNPTMQNIEELIQRLVQREVRKAVAETERFHKQHCTCGGPEKMRAEEVRRQLWA